MIRWVWRQSMLGILKLTGEFNHDTCFLPSIELLAVLQKSLDRALFLYIFIHQVQLSGVGASITIVHIRKFYRM